MSLPLPLPLISRHEVADHTDFSSAWIIVHDLVYDVTSFIANDDHPGGVEILLENLGSDATAAFESVGHSRHARCLLQKYLIGQLPSTEASACPATQSIAYSKMHTSTTLLTV